MSISCQDILLIRAITCLIHFGRDTNASQQLGTIHALRIMSFLAKVTSDVTGFTTLLSFTNELMSYIPQHSIFISVLLQQSSLSSIDEFVSVADDARLLFDTPNCSSNKICAPYRLVVDSLLGIFVRSFLVKWECMSFSDVCSMYEVYQGYVAGEIVGPSNTRDALADVDNLLIQNDILPAQDRIHAYFDASSGQSVAADDPVVLLRSTKYRERHQHAMLSLACMWIRGEYYIYGSVAVEEAMKMSHQRGDHASIARALLLLYYVVQAHPDDHVGIVSAENVLLRCIDRAAELELRSLEAQGKVLLALLRCRQPIEPLVQQEDPQPQPDHHISLLWKLVTSTQYGTVAKGSKSDNLFCEAENAIIAAQALQVAAELWYRLGVLSMAQLCCRRAISQYATSLSTEEFLYLSVRVALITSMTTKDGAPIVYYFNTSNNTSDVAAVVDRSTHALKTVASVRTECGEFLPKHLQRIIHTVEKIIQARVLLATNEYSSALECALDAVDSIGECKQTDLTLQAKLVQALAEAYFEKYKSCAISKYIENRADAMNYSLWKGEALVLRAAIDLYVKPFNISNVALAIQQAKVLSKNEFIPLIDIKISKIEADLTAIILHNKNNSL